MSVRGWSSWSGRTASCAERTVPRERVGFRRGRARPAVPSLIDYIDQHRQEFGVEPICRALTEASAKVAPSTYYAVRTRRPRRGRPGDEQLEADIVRVHEANLGVYGVRTVELALTRHTGTPNRLPAASPVRWPGR